MDEEILIANLHYGESEAFRKIFEEYHARLCFFASKLLPQGIAPEDVVQDTFIKLWEKRQEFDSIGSIQAFLYISVKNHCLNLFKHDKVVKKFSSLPHQEVQEEIIMSRIMEAEVLEKVYKALETLPEGCQNVLQLSYFEGLKNREVAAYLRISVNTVKTQKKRALSLLRIAFKATSLFGALFNSFFWRG